MNTFATGGQIDLNASNIGARFEVPTDPVLHIFAVTDEALTSLAPHIVGVPVSETHPSTVITSTHEGLENAADIARNEVDDALNDQLSELSVGE